MLFFQFVGRLLGLAILHRHFLDVRFVSSFYKRILNRPITLKCVKPQETLKRPQQILRTPTVGPCGGWWQGPSVHGPGDPP
jgi:hypothetical protein